MGAAAALLAEDDASVGHRGDVRRTAALEASVLYLPAVGCRGVVRNFQASLVVEKTAERVADSFTGSSWYGPVIQCEGFQHEHLASVGTRP